MDSANENIAGLPTMIENPRPLSWRSQSAPPDDPCADLDPESQHRQQVLYSAYLSSSSGDDSSSEHESLTAEAPKIQPFFSNLRTPTPPLMLTSLPIYKRLGIIYGAEVPTLLGTAGSTAGLYATFHSYARFFDLTLSPHYNYFSYGIDILALIQGAASYFVRRDKAIQRYIVWHNRNKFHGYEPNSESSRSTPILSSSVGFNEIRKISQYVYKITNPAMMTFEVFLNCGGFFTMTNGLIFRFIGHISLGSVIPASLLTVATVPAAIIGLICFLHDTQKNLKTPLTETIDLEDPDPDPSIQISALEEIPMCIKILSGSVMALVIAGGSNSDFITMQQIYLRDIGELLHQNPWYQNITLGLIATGLTCTAHVKWVNGLERVETYLNTTRIGNKPILPGFNFLTHPIPENPNDRKPGIMYVNFSENGTRYYGISLEQMVYDGNTPYIKAHTEISAQTLQQMRKSLLTAIAENNNAHLNNQSSASITWGQEIYESGLVTGNNTIGIFNTMKSSLNILLSVYLLSGSIYLAATAAFLVAFSTFIYIKASLMVMPDKAVAAKKPNNVYAGVGYNQENDRLELKEIKQSMSIGEATRLNTMGGRSYGSIQSDPSLFSTGLDEDIYRDVASHTLSATRN